MGRGKQWESNGNYEMNQEILWQRSLRRPRLGLGEIFFTKADGEENGEDLERESERKDAAKGKQSLASSLAAKNLVL